MKKIGFLVAFCFVVMLAALWIEIKSDRIEMVHSDVTASYSALGSKAAKSQRVNVKPVVHAPPNADSGDTLIRAKQKPKERSAEFDERLESESRNLGYIGPHLYSVYSSYDDETLLALMDQDDRLAGMQYFTNAVNREEKCSRAEEVLRTGLAGLVTVALQACEIAALDRLARRGAHLSFSDYLQVFSIVEYAVLRGDFYAVDRIKLYYSFDYDFDTLTPEQIAEIKSAAIERLDAINGLRVQGGLDPFEVVSENTLLEENLSKLELDELNDWQLSMLGFK